MARRHLIDEITKEVIDKFNSKLIIPSDQHACWDWSGNKDTNGYGRLYRDPRQSPFYAHRLSYQIYRGAIPSGMEVCHSCDNPSCTNPHHLFLGTHKDNVHDMIKKGRARGKGLSGEANPSAILTWEKVNKIRAEYSGRYKGGMTLKKLAEKYDVHFSTIGLIIQGKIWREK